MKIMQGVAKKLKKWGEFVAKKLIKQDKQELNNCVCYNSGILRLWLRWWLKIRDLRNKVNSLSHVPDQTSTILSSRNLLRCDSGLPRNTQNCTGVMGNVFLNDHMLKKDNPLQSSTFQWIWHLHLKIWDLLFQRQQGEIWKGNRWIRRFKHLTFKVEVEF